MSRRKIDQAKLQYWAGMIHDCQHSGLKTKVKTQGVRCKLKFYKLNEMSCTMFDYVVKSVNNDMEMLR